MPDSTRVWRFTALLTCAVIAAIVVTAPGPNADLRSAVAVHDYGHVIAFGLVTVLLAFAFSVRSRPTFQDRTVTTCLAAGTAIALGASVELAQSLSGRWGDPWDVVRDCGGAISAMLILAGLDPSASARTRFALAGFVAFILIAFAYPVVSALQDERRARSQFPVLVSFTTKEELSRFYFADDINPRIVQIAGIDVRSVSAMQVHLPPGKYPGFTLRHFLRDWSSMRALRLQIVNPEADPIEMTVRIDDADYNYNLGVSDRYNRSFSVLPGANRIEIPLSEVISAPRERQFNLRRVQSLLVYAVNLEQSRNLIIGPITLLR